MTKKILRNCALSTVAALAVTFVAGVAPANARAKDKTPPGAVTGVSVAGSTVGKASSLTVSYTKPKASDLKGIYVWRNTTRSLKGAAVVAKYTTSASVAQKNLKPGGLYWYYLRAYDKTGNGSAGVWIPVRTVANATSTLLSGYVTDANGTALKGVEVQFYRGKETSADTEVSTDSAGRWEARDLPYSSRGWAPCFRPRGNHQGGTSKTGYLPECYDNVAFENPKNAKRLPTAAGQFRSTVTTLATGAGITGRVLGPDKVGMSDVEVALYDDDGDFAGYDDTDSSGTWAIYGAPAATGYAVRTDVGEADLETYTTGVASQWYGGANQQDYRPGDRHPNNVTAFSLAAGKSRAAGDIRLPAGAKIVGTVTAGGENSTGYGSVYVFDSTGRQVAYNDYQLDGESRAKYRIVSLAAGKYYVCATADDLEGSPGSCATSTGDSVDWDGDDDNLPASAKDAVTAKAGAASTADLLIHGLYGTMQGTVTGRDATIFVIDPDGEVWTQGDAGTNEPYSLRVHRGTFTVCAQSAPDEDGNTVGLCRTSTGTTSWDGDFTTLPTSAAKVVIRGDESTQGIDFVFP